MMSGTLSEDPLEAARDYLADFLYDEDWHGDESQDWFAEPGDYASQLPLDDPLITSAALHLQPFLSDDERIESAMYLNGEAAKYIEEKWGGDLRDYLVGFLDAMWRDHARWEELVAEQGEHARGKLDQ